DFVQFRAKRLKQGVASLRDAAAEDYGFGVEDVDEAGDRTCERTHAGEPDARGIGIVRAIRVDERMRRVEAPTAALANVVVANQNFQRAWQTDDSFFAMRIDADVAEMTGLAEMSAQNFPLGKNRSAHARSECEQNRVLKTARGADPRFSEQRSMRVVGDGHE